MQVQLVTPTGNAQLAQVSLTVAADRSIILSIYCRQPISSSNVSVCVKCERARVILLGSLLYVMYECLEMMLPEVVGSQLQRNIKLQFKNFKSRPM